MGLNQGRRGSTVRGKSFIDVHGGGGGEQRGQASFQRLTHWDKLVSSRSFGVDRQESGTSSAITSLFDVFERMEAQDTMASNYSEGEESGDVHDKPVSAEPSGQEAPMKGAQASMNEKCNVQQPVPEQLKVDSADSIKAELGPTGPVALETRMLDFNCALDRWTQTIEAQVNELIDNFAAVRNVDGSQQDDGGEHPTDTALPRNQPTRPRKVLYEVLRVGDSAHPQ